MRKSILIAAPNLRRAKGQTAAITVLILLASAMLNLGLMLSLDYKDNFVRCFDNLHDGHVTLGISARDPGMERSEEHTSEPSHDKRPRMPSSA